MTHASISHYQLNTHTSAQRVHAIVTRSGRVLTTARARTEKEAVREVVRQVRMVRRMGGLRR
jgi:uncharacterized heparinase superfamily protein